MKEPVGSLTVESRKYAGLALRTLAEIARNGRSDTARISASTALLDRGFGRPAQSVDLNLTADAVSKRLSELSDTELAALEARMIALPATLALDDRRSSRILRISGKSLGVAELVIRRPSPPHIRTVGRLAP